jgi:uncharacterized protein YuzE
MEKTLEPGAVQNLTRAIPLLLRFPMERFWVDYDKEADVLYISFRRPQQATDTRATDEGLLLRYRGNQLVGITVLEASSRAQEILKTSGGPTPMSKKIPKELYVERRPEGDYAVRRPDSKKASAVESTQAKAIDRARELEPHAAIHVERVRRTPKGKPDKWRKP